MMVTFCLRLLLPSDSMLNADGSRVHPRAYVAGVSEASLLSRVTLLNCLDPVPHRRPPLEYIFCSLSAEVDSVSWTLSLLSFNVTVPLLVYACYLLSSCLGLVLTFHPHFLNLACIGTTWGIPPSEVMVQ